MYLYPTTNILHRVFHIRVTDDSGQPHTGTMFAIDVNGRRYFVTARHIGQHIKGEDNIHVEYNNEWIPCSAAVVGHGEGHVDVSVLALLEPLVPPDSAFPLPVGMGGLTLGHEVIFLGFPGEYDYLAQHGLSMGYRLHSGFPLPLVKYARVSLLPVSGYPMWLDGHVNQGFSGGPMCFIKHGGPYNELTVSGVIVAAPISEHTGFILAWDIDFCLALIEQNPIGLLID